MSVAGIKIWFNYKEFVNQIDTFLEYAVINYRWVFVCAFLLPLSVLYEVYFYFRNWVVFRLHTAPGKHDEKVREVQRQVRQWNADGKPGKMCTARPGWLMMSFRVPRYKQTFRNVKVNMVDILEIDTGKKNSSRRTTGNHGSINSHLNWHGLDHPNRTGTGRFDRRWFD